MPDLNEPDLNTMFATLAGDLAHQTVAPGAAEAIRRSRRRRTTGVVAGVAAAAAIVVGGAVGLHLADRGQSAPPAGRPTQGIEATPTVLDAEHLSEATQPWLTGWRTTDSPVLSDPPCLRATGLPKPVDDQSEEFGIGRHVGAAATYATFASPEDAQRVFATFRSQLDACATDIKGQSLDDAPRAEVEIGSVPGRSGNPPRTLWVAVSGSSVTLLTVAGAEPPPSEVATGVGVALVKGTLARLEGSAGDTGR